MAPSVLNYRYLYGARQVITPVGSIYEQDRSLSLPGAGLVNGRAVAEATEMLPRLPRLCCRTWNQADLVRPATARSLFCLVC